MKDRTNLYLVILILIALLLQWMIILADREVQQPTEPEKAEIKRLVLKNGVKDGVVLIKWDNSQWFLRDGILCRLK